VCVLFPNIDPFVFGLHWQFDWLGRHWDLGIRWYALAYVAGILLGWRYVLSLIKTSKLWGPKHPTLTAPQVDDLVLWVTIGVIAGGRLGSVLFYNTEMLKTPAKIFAIWEGGMSFHGGVIGVALAIIFFARTNKIALLAVADLVAACQPIGQFFGRIANFINGELWGRPTDLPWGMVFCNERLQYSDGSCPAGDVPRHPSQLYEAALEGLLIFFILRYATHRLKWLQRPGAVTGLFLILYGLIRIMLEFVREPDATVLWGLSELPFGVTMGMLLSVPLAIIGGFLLSRALTNPMEPVPASAPKTNGSAAKRAAKPKASKPGA
jgi:phosphatidylglycerol---prolipoprotein diacylglyceryl transferase